MQPVSEYLAGPDGRGLADEHQEGGLEGVLGVLPVGEGAATDPPDHRAVAADEVGERGLVPALDEARQQLLIR
jgi:hypothetical protein